VEDIDFCDECGGGFEEDDCCDEDISRREVKKTRYLGVETFFGYSSCVNENDIGSNVCKNESI
jgi:hypothetical protein